jgi:hypothetical protein
VFSTETGVARREAPRFVGYSWRGFDGNVEIATPQGGEVAARFPLHGPCAFAFNDLPCWSVVGWLAGALQHKVSTWPSGNSEIALDQRSGMRSIATVMNIRWRGLQGM